MKIILPSMGRCGSTSLFYAIQDSLGVANGRFVARLGNNNFEDGDIIKTHDFAPPIIPEDWKVIYTYGDTDVIRKSVINQPLEWKTQHFYHLNGRYWNDEVSIINNDGMRLMENYLSWKRHPNILFIHYDNVFESDRLISDFLGFDITLPERVKRKTE